MSKIVIDAREYTTSTGRYMFRLLQYLEKIDRENDYVVLLKPGDMGVYEFENPRWQKLETRYKEFTFEEQLGYARQLGRLRADLVHFGMTQQPLLYRGKCVTTVHDLTTARFYNPDKKRTVFYAKQQIYKQVIRRVAHKSAAIITDSAFVKNDLVHFSGIPADKVNVIYLAADPIPDSPVPLPDLQNKQFIMYVGRPTPHKNLERLISAFALLQAKHPALHLVLAGKTDRNYERVARLVTQHKLDNIILTGFISEGQLRWLYEHCAAYVFPSLSEGFGLPGLEAMMHGAPVVASNATCLPEIYGTAAHYFDPTDVPAMTEAINDVLTDEKLRENLVKTGTVQAQKYSWQRMAKQTLAVYKTVLNS